MTDLTTEGQRIVDDAARRHAFSTDAVRTVLEAMVSGGGSMAQFNHPDLGGMGQWSSGGMIMIGDMFNSGLKGRVAALCSELSDVVARGGVIADRPRSGQYQSQGGASERRAPGGSFFEGGRDWWPSGLGTPASAGAQNAMRYAYFPDGRRLALEVDGQVSVYDTGAHRITGFSQQQGSDQTLTFTSQFGVVRLDSLPPVSGAAPNTAPPPEAGPAEQSAGDAPPASGDIFTSIERLAGLRDKGFISEEEFSAKKTDLLKRL